MEEVEQCPFCGGRDIDWDQEARANFCVDCNAVGPESSVATREAATALWNKRKLPS